MATLLYALSNAIEKYEFAPGGTEGGGEVATFGNLNYIPDITQ